MKKFALLVPVVMAFLAGSIRAEVPGVDAAVEKAVRAEVTKVLAIQDNQEAAEMLVADIRAMYKDNGGKAGKEGVPELVLALLVKTDFERAKAILAIVFNSLTEGIPLDVYQRLVAAALLAAEANAALLTEAILRGLEGKDRWIDAVLAVARDTPQALTPAMMQSIRAISATVLPPAVIPPGPYEGQ